MNRPAKLLLLYGFLGLFLPQTPLRGQEVPSPSQVLVATPDHPARLGDILQLNRELTDPETSRTQAVPGTILTVSLDPRNPLAAGGSADGLTNETFVLSRGRAFEPSDGFESVAFLPQDLSKISGVITEERQDRPGAVHLDGPGWGGPAF